MCRKVRSILQGKQGLSMILVLCMGALFAALSAALVYAASVLTANANRQLLEQEVYQLATSFSDILGEQLNDSNRDLLHLSITPTCGQSITAKIPLRRKRRPKPLKLP